MCRVEPLSQTSGPQPFLTTSRYRMCCTEHVSRSLNESLSRALHENLAESSSGSWEVAMGCCCCCCELGFPLLRTELVATLFLFFLFLPLLFFPGICFGNKADAEVGMFHSAFVLTDSYLSNRLANKANKQTKSSRLLTLL